MGGQQSLPHSGPGAQAAGVVAGVGVAALVREVGLAMIPAHLRHTLESITQIIETATKLRAFDEAPYTSSAVMLAALVRHAQLEQLQQLELARAGGVAPVARWAGDCVTLDTPSPDTDTEASTCFAEDRRFGVFATNIYFASLQLTAALVASSMGVDQEDVLFSWLADEDEEHCPKFLVLVDHETASVVLVIRGTFSFKADILAVFDNVVVVPIDPPNCEDFGR